MGFLVEYSSWDINITHEYNICYRNITFSIDNLVINATIIVRRNYMRGGKSMNELLGGRIKVLRKVRNLTQEQLADKLCISRQRYARIESGATSITLDILSKVADALDVTVRDITGVLDESPVVAHRSLNVEMGSEKMFDMIDLFYANKHLYKRIQQGQ